MCLYIINHHSYPSSPAAIILAFLMPILFASVTPALAVECGNLDLGPRADGFGPWDYRKPPGGLPGQTPLELAEGAHLYPSIEFHTMTDPFGKIYYSAIFGSLDYMLRAFPNHPRSLASLSRLDHTLGGKLPIDLKMKGRRSWTISTECYFERAIHFAPDDATAHMLYAIHLHRTKKYNEALSRYLTAERLKPNYAELQYNLGLVLVDMQRYDEARSHAKKAYELGYPLLGLKNKLRRAGYWP